MPEETLFTKIAPITAKSRDLFEFAFSKSNPDFYAPAEDTFLFLDVLETEIADLPCNAGLALEVGPGSGVLSGFFARKMADIGRNFRLLAVDVNPQAAQATVETAKAIGVLNRVDLVLSDAVSGVLCSRRIFDVIICNPPYVPAARDEIPDDPLVHAYAGGLPDGREVTDAVISLVARVLSPDGCFFLLLDERNRPDDVLVFARSLGLQGELLLKRKVPGELLSVWKFCRVLA